MESAKIAARALLDNRPAPTEPLFTDKGIEVREGETIRFVVTNSGRTTHEMVIGSDEYIRVHAEEMKQATAKAQGPDGTSGQGARHDHGTGAAISLAAGQTGELVVTFPVATLVQMACLIPGHYEAGMKGQVKVNKK